MKKTIKRIILPLAMCAALCTTIYALSVQRDLSRKIMRLHIVANSNSPEDTELKLKVRDAVIADAGEIFAEVKTKSECRRTFEENKSKIEETVLRTIRENSREYGVQISFGKFYIPRKVYDGIVLPEGSYDGVKILLGEAKGENWWCVVYPPLCFTESVCGELSDEAEAYLKEMLLPESYSLISEEGIDIKYKLKLVEVFQKVCRNFNKNEY